MRYSHSHAMHHEKPVHTLRRKVKAFLIAGVLTVAANLWHGGIEILSVTSKLTDFAGIIVFEELLRQKEEKANHAKN